MTLVKVHIVALRKCGKHIAAYLTCGICGRGFATLRCFGLGLPCSVLSLLIVAHAVLHLRIGAKGVVVFIGECAVLHDVFVYTLLLLLGGHSVDHLAVGIYNVCIFGIGRDYERSQVAATDVRKVSVVVGEQCGLLCEVYGLLAVLYGIADEGRALTPLAYAGHVADDEGVALVHLVDGQRYRVNLLCGEIAIQLFLARITQLVYKELVYVSDFAETLAEYIGLRRWHHRQKCEAVAALCRIVYLLGAEVGLYRQSLSVIVRLSRRLLRFSSPTSSSSISHASSTESTGILPGISPLHCVSISCISSVSITQSVSSCGVMSSHRLLCTHPW